MIKSKRLDFFIKEIENAIIQKKKSLEFTCEYPVIRINVILDKTFTVKTNDLDSEELTSKTVDLIKQKFDVLDIVLKDETIRVSESHKIHNNILIVKTKNKKEISNILDFLFIHLLNEKKNYTPLTDFKNYKPKGKLKEFKNAVKSLWNPKVK